MKITDYVKSHLPALFCQLSVILVIDAVLLASTSLEKSAKDILYLNILMGVVCILFSVYGYAGSRLKYGSIRKALDSGKGIDYLLPEDDSFYSDLLRDAIRAKDAEMLELVGKYKTDMEELNDYIVKWAHEIKIPISVAELMLENTQGLEIDASRKFKSELERIKFLVNQVLYAGRATRYQEDLTAVEFTFQKAVREALKPNSYFLMAKNVEVLPQSLDFTVVSDEKWVIYILEQILNNASKYVRQDGKIEIFAAAHEKSVSLHIRDNGIGIPPTDLPRIFDKGFTGENGRRTSKSTGMGLYYSKKIADRLDIGFEVKSAVSEYTEFILTFYKMSDYLNVTKI